MHEATINQRTARLLQEEFPEHFSLKKLGFWIYIMSDCILFATLFATYAILSGNYANGPTQKSVFDLSHVLIETLCLLFSSFTCGIIIYWIRNNKKFHALLWMLFTFCLGAGFIYVEVTEFLHMVSTGAGPDRSAFLSAFFTLVGTHGLHVSTGLIWLFIMMMQIFWKGITMQTGMRLFLFSVFWHFLDIIWVCIFTLVYLLGML